MNELERFEYNNEEEAEIAQIQSLRMNMTAVAEVQKKLAQQRKQPSAEFCEECGEDIPEGRRVAIPGVQLCVECQSLSEKIKANYRRPDENTEW